MNPLLTLSVALFLLASPAFAYVGPGAGLSAIGSILAFLGVIGMLILGFVWYPLKRVVRAARGRPTSEARSGE